MARMTPMNARPMLYVLVLAACGCAPACTYLTIADSAKSGIVLLKSATQAEGSASQSPIQPAALPGTTETQPIAVRWDGMTQVLAGKIEMTQAEDRSGTVSFTSPSGDPSCKGTIQFAGKSNGTWTVGCTNGNAASGKLAPIEAGKQSLGEGTDSRGRKVLINVGGR